MSKTYMLLRSRFFCTQCGQEGIPINRKKGQARKSGHLKKLYCMFCKEECNHVEIRDGYDNYTYENFLEEFNAGRFIDGDRVSQQEMLKCSKDDCEYNKNGYCWNCDKSFDCPYRPR